MQKKYSVLMSVYYKENPEWLKISVNSMLNQTIKPDEFVLVEDGPLTTELDKVISDFDKNYPNLFHIVKLEKNLGLGTALQIGIKNCKNEFVARMDSDDYSVPNRIEKQLSVMKEHSDIGMVGSNISEFIEHTDHVICNVVLPESNDEIISFSKKRNPFRHPSILFKKEEVLNAGNYRDYYLCEDYDMWLRMLRNGCRCYNVQDVLVYMRINEDFYKRRGGIKYFKSIKRFKTEQLNVGYFTKIDYLRSIIPHFIVCLMPNSLRDITYKTLLRK